MTALLVLCWLAAIAGVATGTAALLWVALTVGRPRRLSEEVAPWRSNA